MKNFLKTPVLFIIFNRPDTTQKVFDEIKKVNPLKIFIAADGPRNDKKMKPKKAGPGRYELYYFIKKNESMN